MIVFAHLLNDSSGSPQVLLTTISTRALNGESAMLFIGSDGQGCLTNCGLPIKHYWYKRTDHRLLTLFTYMFSQLALFFRLCFDNSIGQQSIIYVNTLLPFGAALYGKLSGRKVIYHIHEISVSPLPLKYLLMGIVRLTSSLNIYVSDTHMESMRVAGVPSSRVYNSLNIDFANKAAASIYAHRREGCFNVLMIASLRDYKGIPEFLELVNSLRAQSVIQFDLVLNDNLASIERYFTGVTLPSILRIHPQTSNTVPFYSAACLVLNLSRVDQWIETFGMTILEAMAFGIPVIVPPVGGPAELVRDGIEGFNVDSRDHQLLLSHIVHLSQDESLCMMMSQAGRERAANFSIVRFGSCITDLIDQVQKMK